ncbi:MAG: hypothetical protein WCS34_09985 [Bacteroidales bacterium]
MKTFKQIQLYLITLAVIGLSTSLTSCQKSEELNNSSDGVKSFTSKLTFGATINPPTTKGELNGTAFTWCSGDQLEVYDGQSGGTSLDSTTFSIEDQDSYTNNASFTGEVEDWDAAFNFYVVYPVSTIDAASSEATSSVSTYDSSTSTLKLTLPCNQIQRYDSYGNIDPEMTDKYDYKIGTIKSKTPTDNLNDTLSNLMTLIDVNITKPSEEMQITKVVIRSNKDLFPTEYDYCVTDSTCEYVNKTDAFSLSLFDADSSSYTSPSNETSFKARFMMCPFSVSTSDEFYIDVYTDGNLFTFKKDIFDKDFSAGVEYYTEMTLNASTEVTSNCYMVAPNNSLKIPVNIRGNGGDVADTGLSTSISPESVGILWETSPDLISLGELDGDKKVSITAGSETGNAVIAAYSGADQSGDVLWSWHIWVTDYDPDNGGTTFTIKNTALASYTFMDRNLGATTATPGEVTTLGLLYQWGRKDPFPGSASTSDNEELTLYNASGASSTSMVVKEQVSEEYNLNNSILNPLIFYYGISTNEYDWYSTSTYNDKLWGGEDIDTPDEKSIFDPCPVGWRVPVWEKLYSPWTNFSSNSIFLWSSTDLGRTYIDGSFYPAAGRRNYKSGDINKVGEYCHIWSGTPYLNTRAYSLLFTSTFYNLNSRGKRAYGFSVRCVKE